MKKLLTILLVFGLVLFLSVTTFAAPAPLVRDTVLTVSDEIIEVGETATFTAVTLKHGSNYNNPTWKINNEVQDTIDNTSYVEDYYTTTQDFTFNEAGIYIVEFQIVMTTGSSVTFVARDSVTIEVVDPCTEPIRYEIRNWTKGDGIPAGENQQGQISGYEATGELWAIYENGEEELVNDDFYFELTPNDNLNLKDDFELYNEIIVFLIRG